MVLPGKQPFRSIGWLSLALGLGFSVDNVSKMFLPTTTIELAVLSNLCNFCFSLGVSWWRVKNSPSRFGSSYTIKLSGRITGTGIFSSCVVSLQKIHSEIFSHHHLDPCLECYLGEQNQKKKTSRRNSLLLSLNDGGNTGIWVVTVKPGPTAST